MLDQRDLERMEEAATRAATKMVDERAPGIVKTVVRESEARQDKKLETLETSLTEKMDVMREYLLGEIEKSQDLVLKEIAVTQNYIERNMDKKIDKIIQRLDKMEHFYRCDKLDSETLSLVVKNIDQLSRRIDAG